MSGSNFSLPSDILRLLLDEDRSPHELCQEYVRLVNMIATESDKLVAEMVENRAENRQLERPNVIRGRLVLMAVTLVMLINMADSNNCTCAECATDSAE